jgi:hypothetical protein
MMHERHFRHLQVSTSWSAALVTIATFALDFGSRLFGNPGMHLAIDLDLPSFHLSHRYANLVMPDIVIFPLLGH